MHVIATAGHVDHGKSTLVRALTGINPDRLREEQQREMTIDLGFAWMTLPGGDPVGIVDVPGHIDFIDNMLAGVGGIDLAVLVIAADEGPMPQTREHLAILELLHVERALVALTKCDMVDDEWIALMRADIEALLAGTPLRNAPIIPVSARTGSGLKELTQAIAGILAAAPPRRDLGKPRLSVDRAFTLQGFGTVVTGTLIDGWLAVGDAVDVITPRGEVLSTHVRGLQTHKQKLERAQPGSRVAINLAGVPVDQTARGSLVTRPGQVRPSTLVDVRVDLLRGAGPGAAGQRRTELVHNSEVKVFSGAAMSLARVWLLEGDALAPGQSGWAQLLLNDPLALSNGDRFILRLPSPSMTVGGGVVIDAHAAMRYRRRGGRADDAVLTRIESLSHGTPAERLEQALATLRLAQRDDVLRAAQLDAGAYETALTDLVASGVAAESNGWLALTSTWRGLGETAQTLLAEHHARLPLSAGMSKESLRSRMQLAPRAFEALLRSAPGEALFADEGETVRLRTHEIRFTPQQQRAVDALLAQLARAPWNTPLVKDCKAAVGDAVYDVLLRRGELKQLNDDVVLLTGTFADATQRVREEIEKGGSITAAQVRDVFGTTRKYALALLEHLDAAGITRREGDARTLRARTARD